MSNYQEHPLYGQFMSIVISGYIDDTEPNFWDYVDRYRKRETTEGRQDWLFEKACQIKRYCIEKSIPVRYFAAWYENDNVTFRTEITGMMRKLQDDGTHLIGDGVDGKEYCLGDAVITAECTLCR